MTAVDERIAYSQAEAAALVGISVSTLRRFADNGDIPRHFIGSRPVYLRDDLVAWIENLPSSP
jgi:excisionase family DNA binding protein